MIKKLKKLILGLVTLAAMAVLCAVCAGAETSGNYEYTVLDDGTVKITQYNGTADILRIPDTISGKKVTVLGDKAFDNCTFTELYIPNGITSIGKNTFEDCDSIKSVTIPGSVETIGDYAFSGCGALATVTVSEGVTRICDYAFNFCTKLSSVSLPDSLNRVGLKAFYSTAIVKSQTTPVKYVDGWAVQCDSGLTSATVSGAVGIADNAFTSSKKTLEKVVINAGVKSIGSFAFSGCSLLNEVALPAGLEVINPAAFYECDSLLSVVLPGTVKSIDGAFQECHFLNSINIPEGVTEIGEATFFKCYLLKSVTIPESVTSIGELAFAHCNVLSSVTLPGNLETIDGNAFLDCVSLKSITIPKSVKTISFRALGYKGQSVSVSECEDFKIYCYSGTAGEAYAKENGFDYELLDAPNVSAVYGFKLGGRAADALRLNWTKNTSADGYIIEKYNGTKWVQIAKITSNATTTYRVTGLSAGTAYKFRMKAYKMSGSTAFYSDYTATLAARTNPSNVTGLTLGGRAYNALRLNWTKNTSADGYIIEMYKNNAWVRVAKITGNATTTYRVTGLSAGTAYKFRVKAYKMSGSTALYSSYTATLSARTNPSNVTGVKIGGRASNALRVNWTKNTSADGYIVEIYKGGKWVRAAKITNNATVTYRISGLAKNTTYQIRIKAYKMSGTTALYSGYTTISGKTTA